MWQGKPIASWTLEEKNHFLTLLMGEEWDLREKLDDFHWYHYHPNYFTDSGFFPVMRYMEKELPEVWELYLNDIKRKVAYRFIGMRKLLNAWLDLTYFVEFLLNNKEEWAWKKCDCEKFNGIKKGQPLANCHKCNGLGKVKHPALVYSESLKEEPCEKR